MAHKPLSFTPVQLLGAVKIHVDSGMQLRSSIRTVLAESVQFRPVPTPTAVERAWFRSSFGGKQCSSATFPNGQKLSVEQEEVLIEFALMLGAAGASFSKGTIRALASTAFNVEVGRAWAGRFLKRHRVVLGGYSGKRTAQRRKAQSLLEKVKTWVRFMNELADYQAAAPTRVFNVDECRLSTQEGSTLVRIFAKNSNLRQLVSDKTYISACMVPWSNAAGRTSHVFFVIGKKFGGKEKAVIDAAIFDEPPAGSNAPVIYYIFNTTGNVCKDTFSCMLRIFSEAWSLHNAGLRCYVWMDNLSAHAFPVAFEHAHKNHAWTLFLPAGTTHIFQPLDQFPFAILKNALRTAKQEDAIKNLIHGLKVKTNNDITVQHAIRALSSCLSESALEASFAKCGLHPWDGDLIVQLARTNVGKLKVATVNATAHKVAQTLLSLMTPTEPPKTVEVEAKVDVPYTSVQLVAMSAERKERIQREADASADDKRAKMADTLKRKRELFKGRLEKDGLPVAGDVFWSNHCTYCASVRKSNSKAGTACNTCDVVFLCVACSGNGNAADLLKLHRSVCDFSVCGNQEENLISTGDDSDDEWM
jgi:hypothetical protein